MGEAITFVSLDGTEKITLNVAIGPDHKGDIREIYEVNGKVVDDRIAFDGHDLEIERYLHHRRTDLEAAGFREI